VFLGFYGASSAFSPPLLAPYRGVRGRDGGILSPCGIVGSDRIGDKNARPAERAYKLFDSNGLFLLVTNAGTRSWRFKYRYGSKEKLLTFGHYPEITLSAARDQRDKARGVQHEGKDPASKHTS